MPTHLPRHIGCGNGHHARPAGSVSRAPRRCSARVSQFKGAPAKLSALLLLVLSLVLVVTLVGCSLVSSTDAEVNTTPNLVSTSSIPHRGMVLANVCLENDADYARVLFHQATALVAQSAPALAQSNAEGAVVWLTLVDAMPLRPANTVAVLSLPPTPAFPKPPTLAPTPTTDAGNPWGSAPAQASVESQNQAATQTYLANRAAASHQLAQAKTQAHAWADAVRALDPPLGSAPPDLSQCVAVASQRFNNWPGATKYLVIAATLPPPVGRLAWYRLTGVHLRWIDMGCMDLSSCVAGEDAWAHALADAGVTDQLYYDPGESCALSDLFEATNSGGALSSATICSPSSQTGGHL